MTLAVAFVAGLEAKWGHPSFIPDSEGQNGGYPLGSNGCLDFFLIRASR